MPYFLITLFKISLLSVLLQVWVSKWYFYAVRAARASYDPETYLFTYKRHIPWTYLYWQPCQRCSRNVSFVRELISSRVVGSSRCMNCIIIPLRNPDLQQKKNKCCISSYSLLKPLKIPSFGRYSLASWFLHISIFSK